MSVDLEGRFFHVRNDEGNDNHLKTKQGDRCHDGIPTSIAAGVLASAAPPGRAVDLWRLSATRVSAFESTIQILVGCLFSLSCSTSFCLCGVCGGWRRFAAKSFFSLPSPKISKTTTRKYLVCPSHVTDEDHRSVCTPSGVVCTERGTCTRRRRIGLKKRRGHVSSSSCKLEDTET
jgi:hypothetical protein